MAASRTLSFPVWDSKDFGPDAERGVADGDWRDPDACLVFDQAQLYPVDEKSAKEDTNWDLGWSVRTKDNQDLGFSGTGKPPEILLQSFMNGTLLMGAIIARDFQRHD